MSSSAAFLNVKIKLSVSTDLFFVFFSWNVVSGLMLTLEN